MSGAAELEGGLIEPEVAERVISRALASLMLFDMRQALRDLALARHEGGGKAGGET